MNLQTPIPAPPHLNHTNETLITSPLHTIQNITHTTQQTLWWYVYPPPTDHNLAANQVQVPPPTPIAMLNTQDLSATPPSTPIHNVDTTSQNSNLVTDAPQPTAHQQPLRSECSNEPWGDYWAMEKPTSLFRVISKNTGMVNLLNLDMQAITKELNQVHASVFAAQETNVNWDVDSMHQLITQCRCTSPQIKIATSTSAEKLSDWYKSGSTLLLAGLEPMDEPSHQIWQWHIPWMIVLHGIYQQKWQAAYRDIWLPRLQSTIRCGIANHDCTTNPSTPSSWHCSP